MLTALLVVVVDPGPGRSGMEIVFCDLHDDLALGFTPEALPDATLTIYPGLGRALFHIMSKMSFSQPENVDLNTSDDIEHNSCRYTTNYLLYHITSKNTLSQRENVNFITSDDIEHNSWHYTTNY